MSISNSQKEEITNLLKQKLEEKISEYKRESSSMPFLSNLVQDNKKVASYSFLQSIATTLGMSIYEQVSIILAKPHSEDANRNVKLSGGISREQKNTISKIVDDLRNGSRKVDKDEEVREILNQPNKNKRKQKDGRIVDFYMKKDNKEYYFEIKTAKPNIDVFTASKRKLLEWIARKDKAVETILAIPYNPYFPEPYSRFTEQGVLEKHRELLVAEEYWDFIGGKRTFEELLAIFDQVGKIYKDKIESKINEVAQLRYSE